MTRGELRTRPGKTEAGGGEDNSHRTLGCLTLSGFPQTSGQFKEGNRAALRGLTLLIHIAFTSSFLLLSFWKPNMMAGAAATVLQLESEKHALKIMEKEDG